MVVLVGKEEQEQILRVCHDDITSGHMAEDRTRVRLASTAWWPDWKQDLERYISTCERCQKANKQTGKRF